MWLINLNFNVDINVPQRKIIDLGKIISRVISANLVTEIGIRGFRQDLVSNSIELIRHEISMLVNSFKFQTEVTPIEEYNDNSSWLMYC
jgi:hypothetical protein